MLPVGDGPIVEQKLGEDNVGHQLLKKMGWEGTGLGTKQQGIQEPIKGGEVRDKQNKYKVSKGVRVVERKSDVIPGRVDPLSEC